MREPTLVSTAVRLYDRICVYNVHDLSTGKVKVRHQMRAMLDDTTRLQINNLVNGLDGEVQTMHIDEPSEQLYRDLEAEMEK